MHQLLTFVLPLAWTPLSWEPGFKGKERRGGGPGAQASCQGKFHPETANRVTAGCPNGNHCECVSVDRPHVLPRGPGEGSVHQGAPRTPEHRPGLGRKPGQRPRHTASPPTRGDGWEVCLKGPLQGPLPTPQSQSPPHRIDQYLGKVFRYFLPKFIVSKTKSLTLK